jgi:fatty acid CoA ligase FadD9
MFTRLLYSLIATGVAPASFYKHGAINYDGLPVDLVASSVVNVRRSGDDGVTVMNIHNYNSGNDFSLDAIVNWIRAAGHEIEAIKDYDDWYQRFSEKLRTLPDAEKQKSAIDLLPAFKYPQSSQTDQSFSNFETLIGSMAGTLPKLDEGYVSKILRDLSEVGILNPS